MIFHILRHVMQIIIRNQNQTETDHRRPKQPCADRDPHGCSDPKTRCRRQTANLSAIGHDDRACAQKANSCQNLRRNTPDIRRIAGHLCKVKSGDRRQRRTKAHQRKGTDTRRITLIGPFHADEAAQHCRQHQLGGYRRRRHSCKKIQKIIHTLSQFLSAQPFVQTLHA